MNVNWFTYIRKVWSLQHLGPRNSQYFSNPTFRFNQICQCGEERQHGFNGANIYKIKLNRKFFDDILYTEICLNRNKDIEHRGKIGLWPWAICAFRCTDLLLFKTVTVPGDITMKTFCKELRHNRSCKTSSKRTNPLTAVSNMWLSRGRFSRNSPLRKNFCEGLLRQILLKIWQKFSRWH